tara:strand:+ start:194 stop:442 length:249 start_codon:yes stop_codon:yes gene_type:complete
MKFFGTTEYTPREIEDAIRTFVKFVGLFLIIKFLLSLFIVIVAEGKVEYVNALLAAGGLTFLGYVLFAISKWITGEFNFTKK